MKNWDQPSPFSVAQMIRGRVGFNSYFILNKIVDQKPGTFHIVLIKSPLPAKYKFQVVNCYGHLVESKGILAMT